MLYESSSKQDLELRHLYIQQLLQNHSDYQQLSVTLYKCITENSLELPQHLPWNTKLFPRLRDYNSISAINRNFYPLSAQLLAQLLLQPIPQTNSTKMSAISALTYSQALSAKTLNDKLNNGFLSHLYTLLNSLQSLLHSALSLHSNFDLQNYVQLMLSYHWFNRLMSVSQGKLFLNKELNSNLLDKLLLHFKWLEKHLLGILEQIQPNCMELHAELTESLAKIKEYVENVRHPLNMMRKLYAKEIMQFQPFYQQEQVRFL